MRTKRRKARDITPRARLERDRKIWRHSLTRSCWSRQFSRSGNSSKCWNAAAVAAGIGVGCAVTGLAAAGALGWSRTAAALMAVAAGWLVVSVFSYRRAA